MASHRVNGITNIWLTPLLIAAVVILLLAQVSATAQEADGSPSDSNSDDQKQAAKTPPDPTIQNSITAIEADESEVPRERKFSSWNQYEGKYITARAGRSFLYDTVAFAQDQQSKQQFALEFTYKIRDFRFLLTGKFPRLKRSVTYSIGIMYDAPNSAWRIRQTGVMIALSEKWGYLFIGRTKEGFSLNKVMVGYDGWTMERATMNDATVPLLADGIKWLGYLPKHGFVWNIGYYNDIFSKGQSFSSIRVRRS